MFARRRIEPADVHARVGDRCFICELVAGNPEFAHHVFLDDGAAIASTCPSTGSKTSPSGFAPS